MEEETCWRSQHCAIITLYWSLTHSLCRKVCHVLWRRSFVEAVVSLQRRSLPPSLQRTRISWSVGEIHSVRRAGSSRETFDKEDVQLQADFAMKICQVQGTGRSLPLDTDDEKTKSLKMDDPTILPLVDVDKGFAIALFLLLCVFLAMMIVRCARLIMDPYKDIPNSMWEDQ